MNARAHCPEHSWVAGEMTNFKDDLKIEKNDREKGDNELWKGVNTIKAWIIAGMGSTVLAMGVFILEEITRK